MKLFFILLLSFIYFSPKSSATVNQLDMNDMSVLLPLPTNVIEFNELLGPDSQSNLGELLPKKYWDENIPVINQGERKNITWTKIKVIGLRFDPCFPSNGKCQPQVRMVWQPLKQNVAGAIADDASLHTFYNLSRENFNLLLSDLKNLKSYSLYQFQTVPLQIHPTIKTQGLTGNYFSQLKGIILKYCGATNLSRITFMRTLDMGHAWEFEGFDIINPDVTKEIIIPRVGKAIQLYSQGFASNEDYENGEVSPDIAGDDLVTDIIKDSRSLNLKDQITLVNYAKSIARIENPNIHSPETMDCLSCHTSLVAGTILHSRFSNLIDNEEVKKNLFTSNQSLENTGGMQNKARVLRAFGYFNRSPIFSRRVINETASIVEKIN